LRLLQVQLGTLIQFLRFHFHHLQRAPESEELLKAPELELGAQFLFYQKGLRCQGFRIRLESMIRGELQQPEARV
jgi:hypothetical protein